MVQQNANLIIKLYARNIREVIVMKIPNRQKSNMLSSSKTSFKSPTILSTIDDKLLQLSDGAVLFQQGYMRIKDIREILEKEGHDERNRQREEGKSC